MIDNKMIGDETFYSVIKKRREQVSLLNIPDQERQVLYNAIDETVRNHESQKLTYQQTMVAVEELANINQRLYQTIKNLGELANKTLKNAEDLLAEIRLQGIINRHSLESLTRELKELRE